MVAQSQTLRISGSAGVYSDYPLRVLLRIFPGDSCGGLVFRNGDVQGAASVRLAVRYCKRDGLWARCHIFMAYIPPFADAAVSKIP